MSRRLGDAYRLYVKSAGGVMNPIAGEANLDVNRNTNLVPQNAKGDGAYLVQVAGKTTLSITVSGVADLPDANGWERIHALSKSRATEQYQIRRDPWSGTDIVFDGVMSTSGGSRNMNVDTSEELSYTLTCAQAPSVDELVPA
jgi:hypothetical protein